MALTFTNGWETGTLGCTSSGTTTTYPHSNTPWYYPVEYLAEKRMPGPMIFKEQYRNNPLDELPEYIDSMDIELGRVDEKYGYLPRVFKCHGDKYVRDPGRDRWIRKDVLASREMRERLLARLRSYKAKPAPEEFKQLYNHDFHKLLDEFQKLLGK